jgi:phosphomethylpyrimidine synthase
MCGPKFWMKITADVRDYAASLTDNEKAALYPDGRSTLSPHPEEAPTGPREARPDNKLCAVSKDEAEAGMREMSERFKATGSEGYVEQQVARMERSVIRGILLATGLRPTPRGADTTMM